MNTNSILIVGRDSQISLITTDREEAEKMLAIKKKNYPELNWGIRSIQEAIQEAYNAGCRDMSQPLFDINF